MKPNEQENKDPQILSNFNHNYSNEKDISDQAKTKLLTTICKICNIEFQGLIYHNCPRQYSKKKNTALKNSANNNNYSAIISTAKYSDSITEPPITTVNEEVTRNSVYNRSDSGIIISMATKHSDSTTEPPITTIKQEVDENSANNESDDKKIKSKVSKYSDCTTKLPVITIKEEINENCANNKGNSGKIISTLSKCSDSTTKVSGKQLSGNKGDFNSNTKVTVPTKKSGISTLSKQNLGTLKRMKCILCERYFQNENSLIMHTKAKHYEYYRLKYTNELQNNASIAPRPANRRADILLRNWQLQYPQSSYLYNNVAQAPQHIKTFICHFCSQSFYVYNDLQKHIKRHKETQNYVSEVTTPYQRIGIPSRLNMPFDNMSNMSADLNIYFAPEQEPPEHETLISSNECYCCKLCPRRFNSRFGVMQHLNLSHNITYQRKRKRNKKPLENKMNPQKSSSAVKRPLDTSDSQAVPCKIPKSNDKVAPTMRIKVEPTVSKDKVGLTVSNVKVEPTLSNVKVGPTLSNFKVRPTFATDKVEPAIKVKVESTFCSGKLGPTFTNVKVNPAIRIKVEPTPSTDKVGPAIRIKVEPIR